MNAVSRFFLPIVLLLFPAFVFGEETQSNPPVYLHDYQPGSGGSAPAREEIAKPPVYLHDYKPDPGTSLPANTPFLSLRLHAGVLNRDNNPELTNKGGGSAFGLEIGIMPQEAISYRLEIMTASTRYDTNIPPPGWGTIDSRMTLYTTALLFGVRGSYPLHTWYRFHATGGVGYFNNELSATGSVVGIPGEVSDDDSSFGFHAGAGFEVNLGDWVLGLDYRRWFVDASFGQFGVSDADVGGNYLGFSVGRTFK